jgi:hypothetical protein
LNGPSAEPPARLGQLLRRLDRLDEELTIYVPADDPVTPDTPVALIDEASANPPADLRYLLEVHMAREVLDVWRDWRAGRQPSVEQAVEAVTYYAERDAYLPVWPDAREGRR